MTGSEIAQAMAYLETLDLDYQDNLDLHKGKWINLMFDKSGRSYVGSFKFNSEAQAKEQIDYVINSIKPEFYVSGNGSEIHHSEYSHTIQIPVGV